MRFAMNFSMNLLYPYPDVFLSSGMQLPQLLSAAYLCASPTCSY